MRHNELGFVRLRRRVDFLRVTRAGRRFAAPGLVLQVAEGQASRAGEEMEANVGIGFTASRKVGNAVARNRVKRRLRAAVTEVMPKHAVPDRDYVLIGRKATLCRSYADLLADLLMALRRTKSLAREAETGAPS